MSELENEDSAIRDGSSNEDLEEGQDEEIEGDEGSLHDEGVIEEEEEVEGDEGVNQLDEQIEGNDRALEDINLLTLTPAEFKQLQFHSSDAAYFFYNEYGRVNGFGIRRSKRARNQCKEIIWVQFVCNREGVRDGKYLNLPNRVRKHRALTRCSCPAELRVKLDLGTGLWFVGKFCDDHNHSLVGSKCMGLSRSHRRMTDADISQFNSMRMSGIPTPMIYGSFGVQSGGVMDIGFTPRECYNLIVKQRQMLENDLTEAFKLLEQMQREDHALYWKYLLADDRSFLHLFWCDGGSQLDYELFGDVLAFDATYGKNRYKYPLIIFSGVNHHKQTCVFGTAIVSNETEATYVWVLQHFLEAMKGKCPLAVITDGDLAMRNAISLVFPEAHHRLCAWHLLRNATSNVGKPYFTKQFEKCMLGDYEVAEFEDRWKKLVEECGLENNAWVAELYQRKMMWATAHMRGKFFAGFRTTSRCEGLHAVIGRYVKKGYNFFEFIQQFERCLENLRKNEIQADYKSQYTEPVMETQFVALEKFASQVYTREIFGVFLCILKKSSTLYMLEYRETPSAMIFVMGRYCTGNRKWVVSFYPHENEFRCCCKRMESSGLPCSHILRVVIHLDMQELPKSLLLDRWTKGVKEGLNDKLRTRGRGFEVILNSIKYAAMVYSCREMCSLACLSNDDIVEVNNIIETQKRRLRIKHSKDVAHSVGGIPGVSSNRMSSNSTRKTKQNQRCSICRNTGHNRSTCPHGLGVLQELHSQGSCTFADDQNADCARNSENSDMDADTVEADDEEEIGLRGGS